MVGDGPSVYDPKDLEFPNEILLRRVSNGWMIWLKQDYDRVDRALMVFNDFDALVATLRKHFHLRERAVQYVCDDNDSQDD